MKWVKFSLALLLLTRTFADHRGPYEYVSDLKEKEAIHIGSLKDEIARPLSFFIENFPEIPLENADQSPASLKWRPLKASDPYLSIDRLETFHDQLLVVHFVRRDLLKKGILQKSGLLLLAPVKENLYKPTYLAGHASADIIETYSIKSEQLLNEETFLCVTCHYSGSGGQRHSQYFRWKEAKLIRHEIWADKPRFKDEIKAAGWELWHRGHWTEPAHKAEFLTVYRPPEKAKGKRSGHAQIKIEYAWEQEQLVAKRWKVMP